MKASNFTELLKSKSEYWGPQIGNLTETLVKQLIRAEDSFNPIDLVKIITNEDELKLFSENYGDDLEQVFLNRIAEQDADAFSPILRRVRSWVEDREIRQFMASEDSFNIVDAIQNNKIIILQTSNITSSKTRNMIIHLFMAQLWGAINTSYHTDSHQEHFLFINQCDIIDDGLTYLPDMLSKSSNFDLGIISIVQQLNNVHKTLKSSLRQSEHIITLNAGSDPSDTGTIAQVFGINSKKISNLENVKLYLML